jgi:hypothetical protein
MKIFNSSINLFYILFFSGLILTSCGGKKPIVYQGEMPERDRMTLLNSLEERNVSYDWFASKASAKIESPQENTKGTVYLRVKKDSMIWVVFKKYSVEASRMLITQDSFFIIYRLDKKYERGSIDDLERAFNVDFSFKDAQQLVVGNTFLPDSGTVNILKDQPHYKIDGQSLDIIIAYWVNGYDLSLEKMHYTDNLDRKVKVTYGDYRIVEGKGRIPYLREYDLPVEDDQRAYLKLEFKEIEFEEPKRTIFRIPDQYEEIK